MPRGFGRLPGKAEARLLGLALLCAAALVLLARLGGDARIRAGAALAVFCGLILAGIQTVGLEADRARLEEAEAEARRVQDYITEHYYTCTNRIFAQLGRMYGSGGSFTENIDKAGGPGTAAFASEVIRIYCET